MSARLPERKVYRVIPRQRTPPDYVRVVRSLTDRDLADEIRLGRGDPDYQAALAEEARRRSTHSTSGARTSPPSGRETEEQK